MYNARHRRVKRSPAYSLIILAASLWCASILLPPVVASIEGPTPVVSQQLYKFFSSFCHQYTSRSLFIFDHKLGVCARCSAIYFGFLVGILAVPLVSRRTHYRTVHWLVIGLAPMVLDVVLNFTGISPSSDTTRIATGLFFGVIAALALVPILETALLEVIHFREQSQRIHYESKA